MASPEGQIRILFVCMGNLCRSPAAECLMRKKIADAGLADRITCDSAGTADSHLNKKPDRHMRKAAKAYGVKLEGRSRQIQPEDFVDFDYVLTMDKQVLAQVKFVAATRRPTAEIGLFCKHLINYDNKEVGDPFEGGKEGFANAMILIDDGCQGLLEKLKSELAT